MLEHNTSSISEGVVWIALHFLSASFLSAFFLSASFLSASFLSMSSLNLAYPLSSSILLEGKFLSRKSSILVEEAGKLFGWNEARGAASCLDVAEGISQGYMGLQGTPGEFKLADILRMELCSSLVSLSISSKVQGGWLLRIVAEMFEISPQVINFVHKKFICILAGLNFFSRSSTKHLEFKVILCVFVSTF